jgi:short-subunit dehydrogenase
MTPDEVASLSLNALEEDKKIVFIPGWKNRLFTWLIQHSAMIRAITQKRVKKRDRK